LSDLLQNEPKMILLEVEGARTPVSHSWRRNCSFHRQVAVHCAS